MKRNILLLCLCLFAGFNAFAYDVEIDGIYYNLSGNEATVTYRGYDDYYYEISNYSGTVVIPESINYNGITYSVTSIGEQAFFDCKSLTSVTIPNSVTSIGNLAFVNCIGLTSITIPNSVTIIGPNAFIDCIGLTSITIPESVTSIDSYAFYGCYFKPESFVNNSSLTSDNNWGATFCDEETNDGLIIINNVVVRCRPVAVSVTIPESVTGIADRAFQGCSSLTSVIIPNSVTNIGNSAFRECTSLTSITIPNGVTSIGVSAFRECTSLTSVIIPESVTSIGEQAFSDCKSLTSITIPESVIHIGRDAFAFCSSLTSITIPESVTSIGDYAFNGCYFKPESFVNNSSLTSDDNWGATLIDEETNDGLIIINNIVVRCRPWAVSVTIPESVTSIGNYAFNGCPSLTSVIINCSTVGDGWFYGLESIKEVVLGDGVTSIGYGTFFGCSNLTSITIPESVTSIGGYAFYGCSSLTSVNIPKSVTNIGGGTFVGCSSLTSIIIPASVTSISSYAFSGCSGLTSIKVEQGNERYDFWNNCNAIIESATNTLIMGCMTSTIPASVTSIGYMAFWDCSGLTSIIIPESVTSIGGEAFSGCSSLTSITIPKGVTSIGAACFYDCSSLTSITIPASVTSIEEGAFAGCSGLISIKVEQGNERYDSRNSCNAIIETATNTLIVGCRTSTIPESVTSIGEKAFTECTSLTSIVIPSSVNSIGSGTFAFCTGLTDFYCFVESVPQIDADVFYNTPIASATLHVPAASLELYKATAPWSGFGSIVPLTDEDAIEDIKASKATTEIARYDIQGRKISTPQKGINIIHYSDGTTKRVMVK